MYGLLLENLATFIKAQWGEGNWESVRRHAGIDTVAFSIHHVYSETLMQRLARSCFQVIGVDERQFFEAMGLYFVQYVSQYGYDQILSVLGRHMRDFLNGLDNLHEYLKFSYPKMRAPSFYCEDETESGLKLHYRSKRRGFVYYVMGQIKQVAIQFYRQNCDITLLSEELVGETMHVVFQLNFDNSAFTEAESIRSRIAKDLELPVRASTLFELFPFCIVFNQDMEITHTGHALMTILRDLAGQIMTEAFDMIRPLIPFCFSAVMQRRNNIFELVTVAPIHDVNHFYGANDNMQEESEGTRLRIRGQMLYMQEWNMMLYLANPVMPDLNSLVDAGLFVNDLSLHDCSRDFVLAGTQQSVELKLALDQEQQKSRKLVESMKKLDDEMRRTDELLYQMIPKQVADRIRKGENPVDTCQTFEMVSVLFSDVVNFTDICSKITPMQVVTMLNHMYSLFDQLTERNGVYKVETIGDSYMVVSGAPEQDARHAERICDMAMDMVDASEAIEDPSEDAKSLRVRVGCHSGMVVAGVVGVKMPRYCLFGDTVNMASRMESTSDTCRIQISEVSRSLLPSIYQLEFRGNIPLKGKGNVSTYWLNGRENRIPLSKYHSKQITWSAPATTVSGTISRSQSPSTVSQRKISLASEDTVQAMPTNTTVIASGIFDQPSTYFNPYTKNQHNTAMRARTAVSRCPVSRRPATTNSAFRNSSVQSTMSKCSNSVSSRNRTSVHSVDNCNIEDLIHKSLVPYSGDFGINSQEKTSTKPVLTEMCTNPTLKCNTMQEKPNYSQKSEVSADYSKAIFSSTEISNTYPLRTGILFFHSCLTAGTPVDNPTPLATPRILVKDTNKGPKVPTHAFKGDVCTIEDTNKSAIAQISKSGTDLQDIYLTHSSSTSEGRGSTGYNTVSRSCCLI